MKMDCRFKVFYFMAILMVVSGHAQGGGISLFADWFPYYGHHLAMFMFASGYFYKPINESDILNYIKGRFYKLVIPMYLYNLFYGLFVQFLNKRGFGIGEKLSLYNLLVAPILEGDQFVYNLGGWYIIPLFMIQIFYVLQRKLLAIFRIETSEWIIFWMNFLLGITGNYCAIMGYNTGMYLVFARMAYFLPFYAFGRLYKVYLEKYDKQVSNLSFFATIFLIKLIILIICKRMPVYSQAWCNDYIEGPLMPFVVGVLGVLFWFRIAALVTPIIGNNKYVNMIANNTYSIMINQIIGFMIVKTVFAYFSVKTSLFNDFDMMRYKNEIWYYYVPDGMNQWLILYTVSGIVFSIFMQYIVSRLIHILTCQRNKK